MALTMSLFHHEFTNRYDRKTTNSQVSSDCKVKPNRKGPRSSVVRGMVLGILHSADSIT